MLGFNLLLAIILAIPPLVVAGNPGTATVLTTPPGLMTTSPEGVKVTTALSANVTGDPPSVAVCDPIAMAEPPATVEIGIPSKEVTTPAATLVAVAGAAVGIAKVETTPDGYSIIKPAAPNVATLFDPASVTSGPPDVTIWPLITTVDAPGAAEITWPPMVAIGAAAPVIGVAGVVGFATNLFWPPLD